MFKKLITLNILLTIITVMLAIAVENSGDTTNKVIGLTYQIFALLNFLTILLNIACIKEKEVEQDGYIKRV